MSRVSVSAVMRRTPTSRLSLLIAIAALAGIACRRDGLRLEQQQQHDDLDGFGPRDLGGQRVHRRHEVPGLARHHSGSAARRGPLRGRRSRSPFKMRARRRERSPPPSTTLALRRHHRRTRRRRSSTSSRPTSASRLTR